MDSRATPRPWTTAELLLITKVAIEKLTELTIRHLEEDLRLLPTLNTVDQMYKRAYWKRFTNTIGDQAVKLEETIKADVNDLEKFNPHF